MDSNRYRRIPRSRQPEFQAWDFKNGELVKDADHALTAHHNELREEGVFDYSDTYLILRGGAPLPPEHYQEVSRVMKALMRDPVENARRAKLQVATKKNLGEELSEASRRGWITRRANSAKRAARGIQ